jgi:hypothetical protein
MKKLQCTKCSSDTIVKDSRLHDNNTIRRRRACIACGYRFSTSEELFIPMPLKKGPLPKLKVKAEYRQKVNTKPPVKPAELHHKEDLEPSFATENLTDEELEAMIYDGRIPNRD